ncbi:hypothetical protein TPY_3646 [Sulfobacillus acidophilus TPY]|nr:hypothetical protein TPY_3646 [Sulfobacillus acidophilus TPY]
MSIPVSPGYVGAGNLRREKTSRTSAASGRKMPPYPEFLSGI